MTVAIIPARGGSTRIPRKNIKPFCGKPMISYSIAAARASGLFDRIIVSTDDEEIASVAIAQGAEAPFRRPAELSDEYTGTNAVVAHALNWLEWHEQRTDLACCIYATAPLLQPEYLIEGHRQLLASGRLFAFSVTHYDFSVQRALRLHADGAVEALHPEFAQTRSQDLEPVWHDAGQFYWGRAEAFIDATPLYSMHSIGVKIPHYLVQDIDTPDEWKRAELMYEAHQRSLHVEATIVGNAP